jgi:hypothetical protein
MLITKLAVLTCAFYLGINVLVEAALFGLALWRGGVAIGFTYRVTTVIFFSLIWLLSFSLSWRIVVAPIFVKIPR